MKKIISIMLVVAILFTFMAPVMASSTSTDKGLENAIKVVKSKINIPEDCKKFTYNIYNQDDLIVWNLGWTNEETQKYINVTINEDNFISNYSSYQYSQYEKKIPNISKEQGQKTAEEFINKMDPKLLAQYKLVNNNQYSPDREYYYNWVRKVNGINFNNDGITVTVNNNTGLVSNYNCSYSKNTKFEDASKIISLEQAKKAFADKLGLKLVYNVKYDNEKPLTYLAYVPKYQNKYIDAVTGNVETLKDISRIYASYSAMDQKEMVMKAAGEPVNISLTPNEIEAVKSVSNLISKEDADKKARAVSQFNLDGDFKLSSASLSKYWRDNGTLQWDLSYSKIINKDTNETRDFQVSIDARTGDIKNFNTYYSSPEGTKPQKTKEQAKAVVDELLKSIIPGTYSNVKYDEAFYPYYNYDEKNQDHFNFTYVRMENGLQCTSDYVTVSYDNLSGNVTSMNCKWTKDLKFDSPNNVISISKANDILFNKIGYGIQYVVDYSNNTQDKVIVPTQKEAPNAILGYFIDGSKSNIISAVTGDILSYSGDKYKENVVEDYTDIKGISGEDKVRILTQLSIKYNDTKLRPNDSLLQKDYFVVLSRLTDMYYIDQSIDADKAIDKMYNELINQGIITKADKKPDSTLTREEAAKYLVKFLRLGKVAEIKGIYKSDFKDANKINPDLLGYVCIASGLKAMNGNSGSFLPKNKITRLEGLLIAYNYLSSK